MLLILIKNGNDDLERFSLMNLWTLLKKYYGRVRLTILDYVCLSTRSNTQRSYDRASNAAC